MRASVNWIDRAIGYLSPIRGARRAQARAAMEAILAYDAAQRGRMTSGWRTGTGTSANAEISAERGLWRDRARDLVRNNAHAAKGLAVRVSNMIGTGIMCQPSGPNQRVNRRVSERWKFFVDNCDLRGQHDLYGLMSLSERTRAESGEAIVRRVPVVSESELDVGFRLHVLEPDYLDSARQSVDEAEIREGIEYIDDVAVAYWLLPRHPGDMLSFGGVRRGIESSRFPASDIIHYYKVLRPGQDRGMTDFAPVMIGLRSLDDFDGAELMRKKVAACLVGVIQSPLALPDAALGMTEIEVGAVSGDGEESGTAQRRLEDMRPGMWGYTQPGETVTFSDPKPSEDYEPFTKAQVKKIASGLCLPYELLSGDLSDANYSSLRGQLVQFRAMIEADQWQMAVPQWCGRVTSWFTEAASVRDPAIPKSIPWTYTPPRFGLLDPAKEVQPMIYQLLAGVESYPNLQRTLGYDWREKLAEIKECNDVIDELGLVLTSDARSRQKATGDLAMPPTEPQ